MTTHTPGPWKLEVGELSLIGGDMMPAAEIQGDGGERIVTKVPIPKMKWDPKDHARALADARLIAAAPDLLEVARRIADLYTAEQERGVGVIPHRIGQPARAAVAKAEGRP